MFLLLRGSESFRDNGHRFVCNTDQPIHNSLDPQAVKDPNTHTVDQNTGYQERQ